MKFDTLVGENIELGLPDPWFCIGGLSQENYEKRRREIFEAQIFEVKYFFTSKNMFNTV